MGDVQCLPEAWELYSRAGSITRLCSGKNGSKPERLVVHRGNPAVATGLSEQSCADNRIDWGNPALTTGLTERHQARTRPAPGPHQARTRPAPGGC